MELHLDRKLQSVHEVDSGIRYCDWLNLPKPLLVTDRFALQLKKRKKKINRILACFQITIG